MARLTCAAVVVLGLACGPSESNAPAPAPAPPATTTAAPPAAVPATTPAPAVADAARGAATYRTLCASCHGETGAGDGPAGQSLDPRPARHDDGAYMNALSNEHLLRVIRDGGPAVGKSPLMAPWAGALSEAQIRDVIAYIRTLAKPSYTGPQP